MELNAEALGFVAERYGYFHDMGYVDSPYITDSRRKMAVLPRTAEILPNRVGAAPGVSVAYGAMNIFVLPGVPKEMQAIFDEFVIPYLARRIGGVYRIEEKLHSGCKDESALRPVLDDAMDMFKNVRIKPAPESFGEDVNIALIISASGNDMDEIREYVEKVKTYLMGKLKEIKN